LVGAAFHEKNILLLQAEKKCRYFFLFLIFLYLSFTSSVLWNGWRGYTGMGVESSRRRFLGAAGILLLAGGVLRFLIPRSPQKGGRLVVDRETIPTSGALVFRHERVALIRQGERIGAVSLVCTHLGCTVTVGEEEIVCPCHGSRFDREGRVLAGPATRPLRRHAVVERGGMVEVLLDR